jgi:hypothetical protein
MDVDELMVVPGVWRTNGDIVVIDCGSSVPVSSFSNIGEK